jgi:5-methyltetrahydrofolate--homocysteine methyltransferase
MRWLKFKKPSTRNSPPDKILHALLRGMDDVGKRLKANEIFVPKVLVSARAFTQSLEILEPVLAGKGIEPKHTVVICTVQGDLHDIGKNLVAIMLKGGGFKVVDLGTDVLAEALLTAATEHKADLVALSALLTTTMPSMKDAVKKLREAGFPVKIIVGGAPITADFAKTIGADGYAPDAAIAVDESRRLLAA